MLYLCSVLKKGKLWAVLWIFCGWCLEVSTKVPTENRVGINGWLLIKKNKMFYIKILVSLCGHSGNVYRWKIAVYSRILPNTVFFIQIIFRFHQPLRIFPGIKQQEQHYCCSDGCHNLCCCFFQLYHVIPLSTSVLVVKYMEKMKEAGVKIPVVEERDRKSVV